MPIGLSRNVKIHETVHRLATGEATTPTQHAKNGCPFFPWIGVARIRACDRACAPAIARAWAQEWSSSPPPASYARLRSPTRAYDRAPVCAPPTRGREPARTRAHVTRSCEAQQRPALPLPPLVLLRACSGFVGEKWCWPCIQGVVLSIQGGGFCIYLALFLYMRLYVLRVYYIQEQPLSIYGRIKE